MIDAERNSAYSFSRSGSEEEAGEYAWEGCRPLLQVVRCNAPELRDGLLLEIIPGEPV